MGQHQTWENTAVTNAFLGALNAFVRNAIGKWNSTADILNYLIKVSPIPAGKVDKINDEWLYRLEDFTRSLSSDDVTYAAGQLLGDVGTVVVEYLLLGKVISLLGKVAGKIGQGIKGITYYLSNGMPAAADGVIAIEGTGAIAISGSLKSALASAGDILFNYSAFKNDWNTLKSDANSHVTSEEGTPDYVRDNRVPQDRETVLSGDDYQRTNYRNKGAQVYEKDGRYYCRDTFHKGESAHLEVFDRFGRHLGEADPLTGELIPGTADPSKILNLR